MATRNQISRLAARIESLVDASTPQHAVTSVIRIPDGMDQQRVLAKHRERWPVTGNGRNPVLVVWLSIAASDNARGDPTGSQPYCDDISWREVAREALGQYEAAPAGASSRAGR
jgi:hypothetical protein